MRWFSLKQEHLSALLPCPESDLLKLACDLTPSAFEHPACSKDSIANAVRMNPSMLLFVLSNFHSETGASPSSADTLVHYCEERLPALLSEVSFDNSAKLELPEFDVADERLILRFTQFLKAQGNKKLCKSLARWLRMFTKCSRETSSTLVLELVGEKLRADQFGVEFEDTKMQQKLQSWRVEHDHQIPIQNLFRALATNKEMRDEFEHKVRDAKLAAMKGLAYGASHEINNPLANVATRAQTMLAIEADAEKRHKLAVIYEQAMRAHEMISDMMLFANPPGVQFSQNELKDLTRSVVAEMKDDLERCRIEILLRQYPDVVPVEIDATQYAMAIKAIVKNSMEAIGSGDAETGQIRIRFFRSGPETIGISIVDDGPGVTDEVADHMFDPFYSGREAGRGLGFGLSKAWRIMDLHQGDVFCDRGYGRGTKIEIRIPISQKQSGQPANDRCENQDDGQGISKVA